MLATNASAYVRYKHVSKITLNNKESTLQARVESGDSIELL